VALVVESHIFHQTGLSQVAALSRAHDCSYRVGIRF